MLSLTYLDNIDQTIFLCNVVPAWQIQHCISYLSHESCLLTMAQHCIGVSLCNVDPEKSGHHCRLFSSARSFVDCETIDPLAAGKYSFFVFCFFVLFFFVCVFCCCFFEFSRIFFVWKQRFGVCLLLILHKQIYLNTIK